MRWGSPCDGRRGPRVRGPSMSTTCLSVSAKTPYTQSRNPFDPGCIQPREDPSQRVVRGDPVRQLREGAQPGIVELAEEGAMATKLPAPQIFSAWTAPGCPSGCAVESGRPADPRNVQGLDQGWGHQAVPEGVLRRLNPEPATVALRPTQFRCNRPVILDRSAQTRFFRLRTEEPSPACTGPGRLQSLQWQARL